MNIFDTVKFFLNDADDFYFWKVAIEKLCTDIEYDLSNNLKKHKIFLEIGACSHWLRPHQTRWSASGGFAWPTGYQGGQYSRFGLPEFDWSSIFERNQEEREWIAVNKFSGKKKLTFRVTLPTKTAKHNQAAIHTMWLPGSPKRHDDKLCQFYGFRKIESNWEFVVKEQIN